MRLTRALQWVGVAAGCVVLAPAAVGSAGSDHAAVVNGGIVWAQGDGIYGARPDGAGIHRITAFHRVTPRDGAGDDFHDPVWTRDGRTLAYTSDLSDSSFIHVVPPEAATERTLLWQSGSGTPRSDTARDPSWSPAGDRIAFSAAWYYDCGAGSACRGGSTVSWVRVTPGRPRPVTVRRRHRFDAQPAWAPDGRAIAFTRSAPNGLGIYLVGADGMRVRALTGGSAPSWSPDSRRIVFESRGAIFVIGSNGAGRLRLGAGAEPSWSPDGRKILFQYGRDDSIWVMDTDGTNRIRLISGKHRRPKDVGWQPG